MEIRPATPQDVSAVLPMIAEICALHESCDPAKYGFRSDIAQLYRNWLTARAADPRSVFLVAERPAVGPEPAQLVGFLVATVETEIPIYRLTEFGFIQDMWVEPNYRHEGLGRQMVMLAVEKFRDLGLEQVRLDTASANETARALFTACGFRVSTIEMLCELNPSSAPGKGPT
jgi:ribosomal protein S18 acetylase RimI-like enzyme